MVVVQLLKRLVIIIPQLASEFHQRWQHTINICISIPGLEHMSLQVQSNVSISEQLSQQTNKAYVASLFGPGGLLRELDTLNLPRENYVGHNACDHHHDPCQEFLSVLL